jgi:hypothetical protein
MHTHSIRITWPVWHESLGVAGIPSPVTSKAKYWCSTEESEATLTEDSIRFLTRSINLSLLHHSSTIFPIHQQGSRRFCEFLTLLCTKETFAVIAECSLTCLLRQLLYSHMHCRPSFLRRAPQQMLRTHRSLETYGATLWWRWWLVFPSFPCNRAPVKWNG